MLKKKFLCLSILLGIGCYNHAYAQQKENYHVNESLVKPYVLPDLMTFANGKKITTVKEWEDKRRPEILHLFLTEVYGKFPLKKLNPMVELFDNSDSALNNTAIRQQWKLTFENNGKKLVVEVLAYLPKGIQSPHVFVVPNFAGNQSIANDPNIAITPSWVWMRPNADNTGVVNNKSIEESRGKSAAAFPLDKIIGNGFGLFTFYYGDVDPDMDDFSDGVHPLFYNKGEQKPKMNEWGAISAWAWGVSRVVDIVKLNAATSQSKIIVMGHSRLGKTALWAGVTDQRIDITLSNNSGCVGAALSRRKFGETVEIINTRFPHWFADNFLKYNNNEDQLPIDQHMLIALIAPRPVYIASGETDAWADPKGEYLSGHFASPVYELYGKKGLPSSELPMLNQPVHNDIGYHIRTGGHGVKDYDWEQYIKFAKMHFSK